jgi:thiol:disulfide interchange protein DsbC
MRKLLIVLFLMVSQLSLSGVAAAKSVDDQLLEKLKKARPDFQFGEVSSTPIKGIYKTNIVNGPTIYITADGKYFFAGDFFEVSDNGLVNLGEKEMEQERVVALSKLSLADMVIFAPEKTKAYRKIASAWCADNPNESLTALKNGEDIPDNVCQPNPVPEHFRIGGQLGVAGTPALVTADGKLLPGYMPADKLAEALGL